MPKTPSTMLPLGTSAPGFDLSEPATGKRVRLEDVAAGGRPVLVMFICNHCPFVIHVADQLAAIGRDYAARVGIVAINSNNPQSHPGDSPEKMAIEAKARGYIFPYLFDDTQDVAKAYHAACTPDIFLFDGDRRLAYRGRLDASTPGNAEPVTGKDLRAALDAVLARKAPNASQQASIGCNIKWKPGNEPAYATKV